MKYAIIPILKEIEEWLEENQLDTYKPVEISQTTLTIAEWREAVTLLLKLHIANKGK